MLGIVSGKFGVDFSFYRSITGTHYLGRSINLLPVWITGPLRKCFLSLVKLLFVWHVLLPPAPQRRKKRETTKKWVDGWTDGMTDGWKDGSQIKGSV